MPPNIGWTLPDEVNGVTGVGSSAQLQAALGHRDGPVVVDVMVDRYAVSLPSHVPAETLKRHAQSGRASPHREDG